ncbi:MAG: sugar phosphate isomerase/epimerase family protein [Archaeoglobaceae archaeon]
MIGNTLWYGHRPFGERIEKLLEIGFDYFEIALDFPFPDESEELKRAIEDYDLKPAFHAPLDILLASPREEIFKASLKVLEKCLRFAGSFETLYFNFHVFHFTPTFLFPEIREKGVRMLGKAFELALKLGRDFGFEICIENDSFFTEDFIIGDVKLTLDLGHLAIESKRWGRDYRSDLQNFCRTHGSKILVVHVHDVSLSKMFDHLPLGRGELDLSFVKRILNEVKPRFSLVEVFWKSAELGDFASLVELEESLNFLRS